MIEDIQGISRRVEQPEHLIEEQRRLSIWSQDQKDKHSNILQKGRDSLNKSLLAPEEDNQFDGLSLKQIWAYSQGHFFNDLCGAVWFNFYPFYLVSVLGKGHIAGYTFLIGQVFDGFMAPLVGIYSDKTNTRWGQKTPWYFAGTIILIVVMPFMYIIQVPEGYPDWVEYFYYIFFPIVGNLGGATLIIIHMSLVPSITCSRYKRDLLNARRNTFSFVSNFFILIIALIAFQFSENSLESFKWIIIIVIIIGTLSSIWFMYEIDEIRLVEKCVKCVHDIKVQLGIKNKSKFQLESQNNTDGNDDSTVPWQYWFKKLNFYQIGLVYMLARLYFNMVSILILFYGVYTLRIIEDASDLQTKQLPFDVAFIPLLMWIGSAAASSHLEKLYQRYGKKNSMSIGMAIVVFTSFFFNIMTPETKYLIYPVTIILGISQAIILTTGITLIGEVVGTKGKSSSYVFGIYCFLDKTVTGITIYFVCGPTFTSSYIQFAMTYVPFIIALLAWGVLMTVELSFEQKKNNNNNDKNIFTDDENNGNNTYPLLPEPEKNQKLWDEFVQ